MPWCPNKLVWRIRGWINGRKWITRLGTVEQTIRDLSGSFFLSTIAYLNQLCLLCERWTDEKSNTTTSTPPATRSQLISTNIKTWCTLGKEWAFLLFRTNFTSWSRVISQISSSPLIAIIRHTLVANLSPGLVGEATSIVYLLQPSSHVKLCVKRLWRMTPPMSIGFIARLHITSSSSLLSTAVGVN